MWRAITEADVLGVLNAYETTAYQNAAAGDDQDVLLDAITGVVNYCRGFIADNQANQLAAGVTLPERCLRPALHLIRKDLITRLDIEVSKDRADDAKEALRYFERVADGKVQIELPTGALDTSSPVQTMETISTHDRQNTRENLSGL